MVHSAVAFIVSLEVYSTRQDGAFLELQDTFFFPAPVLLHQEDLLATRLVHDEAVLATWTELDDVSLLAYPLN